MKWMFALMLAGLLLFAGCPQEEQVYVEPEPEPEPYVPPVVKAPDPIVMQVGYVGPLSGENSLEGTEALNSLKLAASELSTKDYVYEVIEQDGQCTAEGAASALASLVDYRGVDVIIGGVCPEEVDGMAPLLAEKGAVLISLATGNADNEYAMNFAGSSGEIGGELAMFCKGNGWLRTMVITDDTPDANAKAASFDAAAKGLKLSTQPQQKYGPTFGSSVSVIKGQQPQAILVFASDGSTGAAIVKALREGGVNAEIIGDENLISSQAISAMGTHSEGVRAILPEFDAKDPAAAYFMNGYISRYGVPSNEVLVADARNAMYLLSQAQSFYYHRATAQDVQQYWMNLESWAGMGATLTFENGDRVASFRWVKVQGGTATASP